MAEEKKLSDRSSIKDFDSFKLLIKKVYSYCSLEPKDFERLDIDIKNWEYNRLKPHFKSLSTDKVIDEKNSNNHKVMKYDVNQFESSYNFLAKAFTYKTLTAYDLSMTLSIIIYLSLNGESNLNEIIESFNECGDEDGIDDRKINDVLRDLIKSGIITKSIKGKKENVYTIKGINPALTSEENQLKVLYFVDFMKDIIYPNTLGYNVFEDLKYLYKKKTGLDYISPWQMKNQHSNNILDEDVLWQLLTSQIEQKYVSFNYIANYRPKKYRRASIMKIIFERKKQRMYALVYMPEENCLQQRPLRIDKITDVEISDEEKKIDPVWQKKVEEMCKNCNNGVISQYDRKKDAIVITFEYDSSIKTKIKENFPDAQFQDNIATITTFNLKSVNPFFKANIGLISNINNEYLKKTIGDEIEEMKMLYGLV